MTSKEYFTEKIVHSIENRKKVTVYIDQEQQKLSRAKEYNELAIAGLERTRKVVSAMPLDYFSNPDPATDSYLGSVAPMIVSEERFSNSLVGRTQQSSFPGFGTITSSGTAPSVTMGDFSAIYAESKKELPSIKIIYNEVSSGKAIERKTEISERLEEIDITLKNMFLTAWQSFLDNSKERGIILPAHAMRELLSHFLQHFDPENRVRTMPWCEFSESMNPTQKSRVRFAIFGETDHDETADYFSNIKALMNEQRRLYGRLSSYAHFREQELPQNYRQELESYLSTMQNLIVTILDMRDEFQKNELGEDA
jgi:hypothetical protein